MSLYPSESTTAPSPLINDLADQITTDRDDKPHAHVRVAVVTAIDATTGRRVQTDQTGTAWIARSEDTALAVGDRVWMLQTGSTFLVGGRLSGEPSAPPIGSIMAFAGATAPAGWAICDGAEVSRVTNAGLFALIGTTYGVGDGSLTFNLPDLFGKFPLGRGGAGYPLGDSGGAASVALTTNQLPAHTHGSAGAHNHDVSARATAGTTPGSQAVSAATGAGTLTTTTDGAHTHASVGGGDAHENMPPYTVIIYIIRVL